MLLLLLMSNAILIASCTNTKISQSWVDPGINRSYAHLLIIGVSEVEQTRRAYEDHFVEELGVRGVDAEASYKLIRSNKINRVTVSKAIQGKGIDTVLVTHMVAVDEEVVYRPSVDYIPVYGGGYFSGLYSYYPHVNSYVQSPGYYSMHKTYTIESNLYDVESEELVWSARTRTFSPESVSAVIPELTRLLIDDLSEKRLINKK